MKLSLDFLVVGWIFLLIFVVFDDMRCDKGVGEGRIWILVDFDGDFEDIGKVKF